MKAPTSALFNSGPNSDQTAFLCMNYIYSHIGRPLQYSLTFFLNIVVSPSAFMSLGSWFHRLIPFITTHPVRLGITKLLHSIALVLMPTGHLRANLCFSATKGIWFLIALKTSLSMASAAIWLTDGILVLSWRSSILILSAIFLFAISLYCLVLFVIPALFSTVGPPLLSSHFQQEQCHTLFLTPVLHEQPAEELLSVVLLLVSLTILILDLVLIEI